MTIELTPDQHEALKNYLLHQANIDTMIKAGVFDVRRGSAEIHFDGNGKIGLINMHANIYKRETIAVIGA